MSRKPDKADLALWRQVMADVKPLKGGKAKPADWVEAPPPVAARAPSPKPAPAPKSKAPPPPLTKGEAAGLDRRSHQRLRRGKLEIDAKLDLHGLTQTRAHAALISFIGRAAAKGHRMILVVTGKGSGKEEGGVLRRQVPRWLNEAELRPYILAINDARPQHGGEGALYVLLKRARE